MSYLIHSIIIIIVRGFFYSGKQKVWSYRGENREDKRKSHRVTIENKIEIGLMKAK